VIWNWLRRWGVEVVALLLAVYVVVWLLPPTYRPHGRIAVLAEAPLRLEAGARAEGRFTPQYGGWHQLQLRFYDASIEALPDAVRDPLPLRVRYEVRDANRVLVEGTTSETDLDTHGQTSAWASFADLDQVPIAPLTFLVEVVQVAPELAHLEVHVEAGPAGDWINYAWLEGPYDRALLKIGLFLLALLTLVYSLTLGRWRRRRIAAAGAAQALA
jgi:hypothetical protein